MRCGLFIESGNPAFFICPFQIVAQAHTYTPAYTVPGPLSSILNLLKWQTLFFSFFFALFVVVAVIVFLFLEIFFFIHFVLSVVFCFFRSASLFIRKTNGHFRKNLLAGINYLYSMLTESPFSLFYLNDVFDVGL